jgi:acyl-CoA reductase-like NAD-dependent aldehyde dehydrogenase
MVEQIAPAVAQLRKNFLTHKTKTYEWRFNELTQMQKGLIEMRREIEDAIFADLGRSAAASQGEILSVVAALAHDLKHLKTYMQDISEETELLLAPATTVIRYEPMGVVGIFSAWNYPVSTALKPVI